MAQNVAGMSGGFGNSSSNAILNNGTKLVSILNVMPAIRSLAFAANSPGAECVPLPASEPSGA